MSREDEAATGRDPVSGSTGAAAERASSGPASRRRVRGPQFLREVRGELRRVHWPSRGEVASYSLVVLVAVTLLTALVFAFDQAFGALVLWIFG